jgi:ribosomal protein S18 acetylase RimI-like enzyme
MKFKIEMAKHEDIEQIKMLMQSARATIEDPDWFVEDDEMYIRRHIRECGFTLKAVGEQGLEAFFIVDYPGQSPDNLGNDIGFSKEDLRKTVHMESIVVNPGARGNGLQKALLLAGEKHLRETEFRYALATVHPKNKFSRQNLKACGYEEMVELPKYGGLPRIIVKKDMKAT